MTPLPWWALTALITICWATVAALIPLDRWLNRRAIVRGAEQLLHRVATAAHDDQEPTP